MTNIRFSTETTDGRKKSFKFSRKMSKSYCKKTPCKKMGFSQKASCRPFKNCYSDGKKYKKFLKRYIPKSLSKKDKRKQVKNILKSKSAYKKGKYISRPKLKSFKSKVSPHIKKAMKIYKIEKIRPSSSLAKRSGCSVSALKQIVRKGEGAYYSSGSRPNQTAHSWGYARLASALTGGKSSIVDRKILEKGCKKGSKALKMAKKGKSRKALKYKIKI